MAQLLRYKLLPIKFVKTFPRLFLPNKTSRMCFHISSVLDVEGKELKMPSLSPTMETGTIVKWLKKEGDSIQPGDGIAEIQTDKAVITMEFDDEGVMAKIIVAEGTKDIKVGDLIALTVEQGEDWKSVEMPSGASTGASSGAPAAAASTPAPAQEAAPTSTTSEAPPPGQTNVAMPALSPTMEQGTIVRWLKKEGDEINPGDSVAEIQTDKAVMSFEMEEEGILAKILSPDGSQVDVGQLIAIVVEKEMDWKNVVIPSVTKVAAPAPAAKSPAAPAASAAPSVDASKAPEVASGQVYGLAVKRLLEEYNLNANSVKGSGRGNRLLKSDVLSYIQQKNVAKIDLKEAKPEKAAASKAPVGIQTSFRPVKSTGPSTFKDVEVSNIRAVIAKRLGESKRNIPHSYASIDVNIDKLNESRGQFLSENIKLSINDYITKAVAQALVECPDMNVLYQNGQVTPCTTVDISMAVAAPTGLITPIIFNAASKRLPEIADDIRKLALKAREGKLQPQEFMGGSFTISNLGMFGISEFSAIINPPQTAILAVGTGRDILDISMQKTTKMTVRLSYDRRAIDEDQAANFLETLQTLLENPVVLSAGKYQALRHKRN